MTNKTQHIILYINTVIVILGGLLFGYWHFIDGSIVNKPIEVYVDPLDLEVEKEVYAPSDVVRIYSAFCKNRPASVTLNWTLVDTIIRYYPSIMSEGVVGCLGTVDEPVLLYAVTLPPEIPGGVYYLENATRVRVNPIREINNFYRTEKFIVISK